MRAEARNELERRIRDLEARSESRKMLQRRAKRSRRVDVLILLVLTLVVVTPLVVFFWWVWSFRDAA